MNWFDVLVLDCLWFCHDYWFHIKGSLNGMLLAAPAAVIAGVVVL